MQQPVASAIERDNVQPFLSLHCPSIDRFGTYHRFNRNRALCATENIKYSSISLLRRRYQWYLRVMPDYSCMAWSTVDEIQSDGERQSSFHWMYLHTENINSHEYYQHLNFLCTLRG